jgi:hypothetical protein
MRDTFHNSLSEVSSKFAARTKAAGAVDGEVVDLAGFEGATIVCASGALGTQVNVYPYELKESDAPGSGFAAVAAADLLGSEPSFEYATSPAKDESDLPKSFGYTGAKRYVRLDLLAPTGSGTGGGILGGLVVKGSPRHAPSQ